MNFRTATAVGLTSLLATGAFAGEAKTVPACCRKPKATDAKATDSKAMQGKMRCSLTGKVVDKCCCEQREGKTYCTLASKSVEKCCCTPVADPPAEADAK